MSENQRLGVCIVGCGQMGGVHVAGWKARDDVRITAVCDPIQERRDRFAADTGATAYATHQEAIARDGVNVVSVCTPVCFHSEITCFAARHGRHVLCEKPLALTIDQADAAIGAAQENGVLLSTSFQNRGLARNIKLRELVQGGAFGGPIFARYADVREVRPKLAMHRRSMNGGPVIDMAGHFFDMMRFITGAEPLSVCARGHVFGKGKPRLAGIDDLAIDAADIQVAMEGGHVLSVFVCWGMPEGFGSFGEEYFVGPDLSVRATGGRIEVSSREGVETWDPKSGNPHGSTARINDMADAVIEGRAPEVTGEDGRIALQVSLAALESIETGRVVRV